jgi:hypothetical protein
VIIKIPGPPAPAPDPDAPHQRALCWGRPRCKRVKIMQPCDDCYMFWSDDERSDEEILADMERARAGH